MKKSADRVKMIAVRNAEGKQKTVAEIEAQNKIDYIPKVSVIIPVYNVEMYLRACLDSVVGQTLREIEIICVDDGSTDSSLEILKEYAAKDERIMILKQKNEGVSIARNHGIDVARGEFIGFVDSDDWIDDNFYETLYATARQFDADVVKGNMCYVNGENFDKTRSLNASISKETTGLQHIIVNFLYEFSTAIYKHSIIKEKNIRFKKASLAEDVNFLCHFLCHVKTYRQCDDVFYYYLNHRCSATKNLTSRHLDDLYQMFLDMSKTVRLSHINSESAHSFNEKRLQELKSYLPVASHQGYLDKYQSMIMNFEWLCERVKVKRYWLFGFIPLLQIEGK